MQVVASVEGVKSAAKKAAALAATALIAGVSAGVRGDVVWSAGAEAPMEGGGARAVADAPPARKQAHLGDSPPRCRASCVMLPYLPLLQSSHALTFDELQGLTYLQVKGTGVANTCPTLGEASANVKDLKPGSYKLGKFCMEPTSFTVKEESQVRRSTLPRAARLGL